VNSEKRLGQMTDFLGNDFSRCRLVEMVVEVLTAGKVVLHPTDTIYGLAADATSFEAVTMLRTVKNGRK